MKHLINTAILTALLCTTALNAQAMGKNPEETLPQNPPAHVDSPVLPISSTTAEQMLKLQAAPDVSLFAGKWILIAKVNDLTSRSDAGAFQESGLRESNMLQGIEMLEIKKVPIALLPEQAQFQYFAKVIVDEIQGSLPRQIIGNNQTVVVHENYIQFKTAETLVINILRLKENDRFESLYSEYKKWPELSRFSILGPVGLSQEDIPQLCGISASDHNLLLCKSEYNYTASWGGDIRTKKSFRAYKRVAEGK